MQRPALVDSPEKGPPARARLFLFGVSGLLLAAVVAAATEIGLRLLGVDGRVSTGFFVVVAALAPALALGLLVQLVTALAGRARRLLRELKRFDVETSAEGPELDEQARRERKGVSDAARLFLEVIVPFEAGLAMQFVVTEAVAVYCIAAGVEERAAAIALGVEVAVLFVSFLCFHAMLRKLTRAPTEAAQSR